MFRVMVVEDEPPILDSICKLLAEHKKDFSVVHTAFNGRRALDYLEENTVDIIFTDIKMPVMDGLELAREVSLRFPETIVVIISGFSEFEFARTAIHYGVKDYLLKPISRERINDAVLKCFDRANLIEKKRLNVLLRRAAMGENIEIDVNPTRTYGALLYCEGAFPAEPDELPKQSRLMWDIDTVAQKVESLLAQDDMAAAVLGRSLLEKLVVFTADNMEDVKAISRKLFSFLTSQSRIPVTMLVQNKIVTVQQIIEELPQLRAELYDKTCIFHSSFLMEKEYAQRQELDLSDWRQGMVRALKSANSVEITSLANKLVDVLVRQPMRQKRLQVLLEKITLNSLGEGGTLKQMEDLKKEIQSLISTADLPEYFAQSLGELLITWAVDTPNGNEAELCEEVAVWLKINYNKNINNMAIAAKFNLPAARISKQFKDKFGISISEYVNNFRIELAKTMMRDNPKARIKEIAIDVGFSDQYYFSKIFKKVTGCWPTEYTIN